MTRTETRAVSMDLLPHLRRARDHMDRHYDQPLDLDQLASVAGVSKFHFVRSFEATYADTPIRICRAAGSSEHRICSATPT